MSATVAVERVPLARLRPAPWNPRLIRDARFKNLCKSIEADPEFMERRPVLAMADGTIYAGNMRYRAAEHLKWSDVPAVVEDVPEQLAKERALRDNQQWGEWQEDDLAALIYELSESGADLDLLGFESAEIDRLLQSVGVGGPAEDPGADLDRADELREKWQTARGQLWVIPSNSVPGREHRLLCGDSTSAEDVARLMAGERGAMLFTDPPYGVDVAGGTHDPRDGKNYRSGGQITGDTLDDDGLRALLSGAMRGGRASLVPGGPFYIWHPSSRVALFAQCVAEALAPHRQIIVWVKPNFVFGRSDYHYQHEPCFYGWVPGGERPWLDGRDQSSVWEVEAVGSDLEKKQHPSAKPVGLAARAIGNHVRLGGVTLDIFLGSGTTMVAAEQTGRLCYGMEIEPKYVAVALERLAGMGLEPRPADG